MLRFLALVSLFGLSGLLSLDTGGGLNPLGLQSLPPAPSTDQGSGWDPNG